MNIIKYVFVAAAMLSATACNGKKSTMEQQGNAGQAATQTDTKQKALVVYFSHAGDNYSVGVIKVGNTKLIADYIADITGADQFELKTKKYDGMAYTPLTELAKKEQQRGELPAFEGSVDVSKYSTIFIGGPVWWGTYPQIMFTFFKQYDLNGKTLIPFTTHEGSGLGRCVEDVKAAYPKATVLKGFSIYGHDASNGKPRVEKWLKGLGFGK